MIRYKLIESENIDNKERLLNKKTIPVDFKRLEHVLGKPISNSIKKEFYTQTGLKNNDRYSCNDCKQLIIDQLTENKFQANLDDKYHQYGKYKFLNGFVKFVKKAFDRMLSMLTSIMSMSLFTLSSPFIFETIPTALFASFVFISICFYIKSNKAEKNNTNIMFEGFVDNIIIFINRQCQQAFDKIRPVWEWFFGDPDVIGDVYIRRRRQTLLVVILLCMFAIIKYV